jgi:hypothetical protein
MCELAINVQHCPLPEIFSGTVFRLCDYSNKSLSALLASCMSATARCVNISQHDIGTGMLLYLTTRMHCSFTFAWQLAAQRSPLFCAKFPCISAPSKRMCWYVNTVQSLYHPFTIGTLLPYVMYLILWLYHSHFICWIDFVTAINVLLSHKFLSCVFPPLGWLRSWPKHVVGCCVHNLFY